MPVHKMEAVTSVADLGSDVTIPVFAVEATKQEAINLIVQDSDAESFHTICEALNATQGKVKTGTDYAYFVIKVIKG